MDIDTISVPVVGTPTVRCPECHKVVTLRNRTNSPREKVYCPECRTEIGRLGDYTE